MKQKQSILLNKTLIGSIKEAFERFGQNYFFEKENLPTFGEMRTSVNQILKTIPVKISSAELLDFIDNTDVDSSYLDLIKSYTNLSDEIISACLNINVKTYRTYRGSKQTLKKAMQEHTVMFLALIKHGLEVFGSPAKFTEWLEKENFYLNKKKPLEYLDTISGIKFIDNRLTAMEYGDNV